MEKDRLGAFIDAVLAIIMTIKKEKRLCQISILNTKSNELQI